MSWYPLILLVLVLLFDPFLKVSLLLTSVVVIGFVMNTTTAFGWVFGYGLLYDLRQLNRLGFTSLLALSVVLVIGLIKMRFESRQGLSVLIISMVLALLWQMWIQPPFDAGVWLLQVGVNMGVWALVSRVGQVDGVYLRSG